MEPLQTIAFTIANDATRRQALSALPDAPRVPHEAERVRAVAARTRLATLLRRTADRVDPCLAPSAG